MAENIAFISDIDDPNFVEDPELVAEAYKIASQIDNRFAGAESIPTVKDDGSTVIGNTIFGRDGSIATVNPDESFESPIAESSIIDDLLKQLRPDLNINFNGIYETPTIFPDKQGKVNIDVTNRGIARYQGPLNLNIYASTDAVLDKNPLNTLNFPLQGTDELLGTLSIPDISLRLGQSKTFTIDFTSADFRTPSVVAPGAYYLIGEVDTTIPERTNNNKQANQFISTGDPVIVWNATLLNAIEASGKNGAGGTAPPLAARNQAIVHAAIFDAVNAIDRSSKSLYVNYDASDPRIVGASTAAAADYAAYTTLADLFPNQKATFDEQLSRSLAQIPNGTAKDKGIALGIDVANQILVLRRDDHSATAQQVPYTGGGNPGEWRPTPPDRTPAVLPGWGLVTTFSSQQLGDDPTIRPVIPSRQPGDDPTIRLSQFGLSGPPAFGSDQFVNEENKVRVRGGFQNTAVTTIDRTADETQYAIFWSYDRPDTFRPPGQWNEIAEQVALQRGNTLQQNALLFAQLNIAEADVGILTWDAKYTYNQLRPITAIRQELPIDQSNVVRDPEWEPLLSYFRPQEFPDFPITPAFPDYNSGHAAFGGAAGQVLINFFGDNTPFDIPSQELPGISRHYDNFSQAINENADSRIVGGVHVPSSAVTQIAPSIASFANDGIVNNVLQSSLDPGIVSGSLVGNLVTNLFM